jgi:hypothetical protein
VGFAPDVVAAVGRGYYSDMDFHYFGMDCFDMDLRFGMGCSGMSSRFGMGCFGMVDWDFPIVNPVVIVEVAPIEALVADYFRFYCRFARFGFRCPTSRFEGLGWGLGRRW